MASPEREPIRVLIVDDSALIRKLLADLLKETPGVLVVGSARDGEEALDLASKLKPDVVTLDVEMPGLSGLDILPRLISEHGVPVVMVSSLTQVGADITLNALELGAVDYFPKPDRHQVASMKASREVLVGKILAAAGSRVRRGRRPSAEKPAEKPAKTSTSATPRVTTPRSGAPAGLPCVVIGISTGGPQALGQVLPLVAPPTPPILIVQHMPAQFTGVFAQRLNRSCSVPVKEAETGDPVVPNQILIAPGGRHMTLTGHPPNTSVAIADGPLVSGHKPSIDMLFQSAAKAYGPSTVGIIMTGMGRDGVEGCKRIRALGGTTFGQDEGTSVVYGMNKQAFLEGGVVTQFSLEELPTILEQIARGN